MPAKRANTGVISNTSDMIQPPPPNGYVNYSKCDVVKTEINHDLNPPVSLAQLKKNENTREVFNSLLSDGANGCKNYSTQSYYDDSSFVQSILGFTPEQLILLPSGTTLEQQQVLTTTTNSIYGNNNDTNSNSLSERSFVKIKKISKDGATKKYGINLFNLFDDIPLNSEGICELFFVIDTGDDLVQNLMGLVSPANTPTFIINVIHSQFTLGDSAPKTLPDSPKYKSKNTKVRTVSWYLTDNLTVPQNDPLFLSSISISSKLAGVGWKIRQDWKTNYGQGDQLVKQTFNAKEDNSKPEAVKYLTSVLPTIQGNFLLGNVDQVVINEYNNDPANLTNPNRTAQKTQVTSSITAQGKRSGDHLQIWICKMLIEFYFRNGAFIKVRETIGSQYNPLNDQSKDYRKHTFVITGDWPCFAYCVYNKINVIIMFRHPNDHSKSCSIKVSFY